MQRLAKFVKWQEYGFSVEGIAYSVDEALALMERTAMDVVFMDIRMPGKTGLYMLQIIQKSYPGVKSVILSGFSEILLCEGGHTVWCGGLFKQTGEPKRGGRAAGAPGERLYGGKACSGGAEQPD